MQKDIVVANEMIRQQLLSFLAEKYELNGGEHNDLSEFYSLNNLSEAEVISTLSNFVQTKIITLSLSNKLAHLTAEGYSVAKPDDVSVKQTRDISVAFNAPVNGSPIAIGNNNSSSIINNNIYIVNELTECIKGLREEIKSLNLPADEQDKKLAVVDQIERLIESEKPDVTLINTLLDNALPITVNITSLIASISSLLA